MGVQLIHSHFPSPTVPLFPSKIAILLCFFNLVHRSSVGEILDLAWWYPLLLLHALDCIGHADVLLNTKFLEILLEIGDAVAHLISCLVQFGVYFALVDVNLAIFEIFYFFNGLGSTFLVEIPLLVSFLHPFFHESLILE